MRRRWFAIAKAMLAAALVGGCLRVPPVHGEATDAPARTPPGPLWPGLEVGDLYRPGEVRAFEIRQGGRVVGHSWGRYVGPESSRHAGDAGGEAPEMVSPVFDRHRFETRIEMRLPGREPLRSAGEIVLDERGHLVEGFERSNAAELSFCRAGDVVELQSGRLADEVGYDPGRRDVAFMAHSAILHEEIMLGLRKLVSGEQGWRLISLSGGAPVEWSADVHRRASDGTVELRTSLGELITMSRGRIVSIEVEADEIEIVAVAPAWPSWAVDGPRRLAYEVANGASFERREVELPGRPGEPRLTGEVLIPTTGKGPHPGVLFLSGTGQQDRYGFAGPPPVDLGSHEITDALANAGVAVLRYDERGFGGSEAGDGLSFLGQVEDGRRGLRTLLAQQEVDPDRIVVVAHGEGGWRALKLVASRPEGIRGIALLASPGRPYHEVFASQADANLRQVPPELRDSARQEQRRLLEQLRAGDEVPPELRDQATWIREVMKLDPAKLVGAVRCHLWIAQGGKDFEVDPKLDAEALRAAATRARRRVALKRYPGLDHLFKPEPGVSTPARYLEPDRHVDTQFLTDLLAWVRARTR